MAPVSQFHSLSFVLGGQPLFSTSRVKKNDKTYPQLIHYPQLLWARVPLSTLHASVHKSSDDPEPARCQFSGERRETGLAVSALHPEAALGSMVLRALGPEPCLPPRCLLGVLESYSRCSGHHQYRCTCVHTHTHSHPHVNTCAQQPASREPLLAACGLEQGLPSPH